MCVCSNLCLFHCSKIAIPLYKIPQHICPVLPEFPEKFHTLFILSRGGWLQSGSAGPLRPGKLCQEAKVEGPDCARILSNLRFPRRTQKFRSWPTATAGWSIVGNIVQINFQEASQQNDILHLEMAESYANLPRKTLAGLEFALQRYCHQYVWVVITL